MNKMYIVQRENDYCNIIPTGFFKWTQNPLEATMFKTYEEALRLRSKYSNSLVPVSVHSIVFEVNTEEKLNQTLQELDDSIKRIDELKANLESQYNE